MSLCSFMVQTRTKHKNSFFSSFSRIWDSGNLAITSRARRRSTEQHVPKEAQTNHKKCGSRYKQKQNFVPFCCFGRLHTAAHTENPVWDTLYLHWGLCNCSHANQAGLAHLFAFCQSFSSSKRTDPSSVTSCTELQTVLLLLERKSMKHQTKENADKLLYRGWIPSIHVSKS